MHYLVFLTHMVDTAEKKMLQWQCTSDMTYQTTCRHNNKSIDSFSSVIAH